jgi:hypothetical protein
MKVIAKRHSKDFDMVELWEDEKRWLLCIIHVDSFEGTLGTRLYDGEEITLRLEEA